jgi:hypothetical protein
MDKKVLLTTTISMGAVLVWVSFFGPKHNQNAEAQKTPAPAVATANPATAQAAADAVKAKPADKPAASAKTEGPPAPPAAKATVVESTFEQPKRYRATFTSENATPTS